MPTQRQPSKHQLLGSFDQLPTPEPSSRDSIRPDLDLPSLEPPTIHLAYQLYQYVIKKSTYSHRPFLQNIETLLKAVVSVYPLPKEFGSKEQFESTASARFPDD